MARVYIAILYVLTLPIFEKKILVCRNSSQKNEDYQNTRDYFIHWNKWYVNDVVRKKKKTFKLCLFLVRY